MVHHIWSLSEAGPDNLGLAVSDDGLVLGGTPLVERRKGRFVVRDRDDVERLLRRGHRYIGEAEHLMPGLAVVARALNASDPCLARIAAVHLKLPDLPSFAAREAIEAEDRFIRFTKWDPEKHPRTGTPPNPGWFAPTGGAADEDARGVGVPAASGAWTRTASWLAGLSSTELAELGLYALRVAGPVGAAAAVFGLVFVPSPNDVHVEGEVPGIPGLRYSWNTDEALLHFTYDAGDEQRTFAVHIDGDQLRDEQGQIVGRVIGGNRVAVDAVAALPDLLSQDEPRLCPEPAPDRPGSDRGKPYDEDWSRQYADFLKQLINPQAPTPSGFAYYLPNPGDDNKPVRHDDCQKATGFLFDYKGEKYARLLAIPQIEESIANKFLDQATNLMQAGGDPSCGSLPKRKRRRSRASSLTTRTRVANISPLASSLGQRWGHDERAVLSLHHTVDLDGPYRGAGHCQCEILEDARRVNWHRPNFYRLGSIRWLQGVVDSACHSATVPRRDCRR